MLVQDSKNRNHVSPTLSNVALNYNMLKPFTEAMVAHGRIAKPIGLIKEALREFYASEKDDEAEKPETTDMKVRKDKNINKTAEAIKSMLTVVKRKWTKWELPRVPWLPYTV